MEKQKEKNEKKKVWDEIEPILKNTKQVEFRKTLKKVVQEETKKGKIL